MKTLLILRHAKAEPIENKQPDFDRRLAPRGRREAPRMGELIVAEEIVPQLVLSSPAARARETAELAVAAMHYAGPLPSSVGSPVVTYHQELYMATPTTYVSLLREAQADVERVLVVGHNPTLEDLVWRLTGESAVLPTACLAVVRLAIAEWSELAPDGAYELVQLLRAKE
jgi:phosphohistidine phosphatase